MPYIQQVSVAGASPVCGRLVERLGERIGAPLPGSLHSLFPTANAIAAADVSVLDMPKARAMDHTDAFPASDLSLRKSAARAFGHQEIISARELAQRSLSWRPWRTTAIAYLWMYPSSPVKVVGGNNL
ncbi:MAG: 3-methyladenine DNA glycosylase/8-oxoguanine DNA glycosylase [Planctomycetota bacterium]|jgi:3-methyladenine DNA glycosylase/8-oxoguanine DNA glycosylase